MAAYDSDSCELEGQCLKVEDQASTNSHHDEQRAFDAKSLFIYVNSVRHVIVNRDRPFP